MHQTDWLDVQPPSCTGNRIDSSLGIQQAVVLLRQFVELAHVVLCYLIVTRNVRPRTWILQQCIEWCGRRGLIFSYILLGWMFSSTPPALGRGESLRGLGIYYAMVLLRHFVELSSTLPQKGTVLQVVVTLLGWVVKPEGVAAWTLLMSAEKSENPVKVVASLLLV